MLVELCQKLFLSFEYKNNIFKKIFAELHNELLINHLNQ